MKKSFCIFLFSILCLLLPFTLTIGNGLLITHQFSTYQKLISQNPELKLSKNEKEQLAKSLYEGIVKQKSVQTTLENGEPAFSEKEITHMKDVSKLTKDLFYIFFLLLPLIAIAYWYLFRIRFPLLYFQPIVSAFLSLITVLFILFHFDQGFTMFHQLSFQNNFWLLDPSKDLLINLFPVSFFIIQFSKIGFMTLLELVLLFLGLRIIKK